NALLRWATAEQKKRCLPRMAADTAGAYALSEAGSGSDAFALKTRAELKGSDYVLNGRKLWITNAKEAGLFVLFATIDLSAGYKGITAFIIEKELPGFTVGKKEDKLGIRASSTCELILEDCRVPRENVLGEVGKGYKIAIETYGGYGFTKDYPVEKYWRDAKIGKIYEGTSNMQLQTIAKLMLGK